MAKPTPPKTAPRAPGKVPTLASAATKSAKPAAVPPAAKPAKASVPPPSPGKPSRPARRASMPDTSARVASAKSALTAAPTATLKHLAAEIGERHGMPAKQAETVLAAVFEAIVARLKAGERVRINGFGIIEVKDRPARAGRNPATGEAIQIAASRKLAFRPAKELKAAV